MNYMLPGLVLFFCLHLLPTSSDVRQSLIERLGHYPYLALYSLLSAAGLGLMILGYSNMGHEQLWSPFNIGRPAAMAIMPIAFILLLAAYLPCHLRSKLKHPMLIATALWGSVHLLANGDLASSLLFGSFLGYALLDMALAKPRSSLVPKAAPRAIFDLVAVIGGLLIAAAVMHSHGKLFGVALIS